MHTFGLNPDLLRVTLSGRDATLDGLFPSWHKLSRFGIVVCSPLGCVGASLLIQAAISQYFRIRQGEHPVIEQYPEIYAFHIGGPFGDLSYYDFLPPRREVFLPAGNPMAVLEAINDRSITHLAVPNLQPVSHEFTWQERGCAQDRVNAAYVYDPAGRVENCDVRIVGDVALDHHTELVLQPAKAIELWDPITTLGTPRAPTGDGSSRRLWLEQLRTRMPEVASDVREAVHRTHEAMRHYGRITQTYRMVSLAQALGAIAGAALLTA